MMLVPWIWKRPCFHADDPLFLSSSCGALQAIVAEVASWAHKVGAAFHVGMSKTVAMFYGLSSVPQGALNYGGVPLQGVVLHKWLGVLWPSSLDFTAFLQQRTHVAAVALSQLAGFAASSAIPWLLVAELFESKVDSILDFGRWLFILAPEAAAILNSC